MSHTNDTKSPENVGQDNSDINDPGTGWKNMPMMMAPHLTQDGQIHLYKCHRRYIHTAHGWSRTGSSCPNDAVASAGHGGKVNYTDEAKVVKSLMGQLCEKFYAKGWMPGTGGGMSIRIGSGTCEDPYTVFSTPSGIQKEDMIGDDVFELSFPSITVVTPPITPGLKLSSMTNIWYTVYKLRPSTMCVIHTHSMSAQLATLLGQEHPGEEEKKDVLRITHQEMIKGVGGHAYSDVLEIPIIDNQTSENLLAPDMEKAIQKYPNCNAVLVRRHGVYCWGDSWEEAKTRIESFDYLFESAVKMKSMGIDCGVIPGKNGNKDFKKRKLNDV